MSQRQFPLAISPSTPPGFDNFSVGDNALLVDMMQRLSRDNDINQMLLWGAEQTGKSHLLQAVHNDYLAAGRRSFYVSLADLSLSAELLTDLDGYELVALDDIHHVAGDEQWEQSLFNLINFIRQQSGKLIFSSDSAPANGQWKLPDLISRLSWGPVVRLEALSDIHIREALMMAVEKKGLEMPQEAADYLLKRHRRDMGSLLVTVGVLDRECMAASRSRITIPFLKACLTDLE